MLGHRAALGGVVLGGVAFTLSLIFHRFFIDVGVAPSSIVLLAVLLVPAMTCGRDPLHPARLLAGLLALSFLIGPVVHALTGFYALPDGSERQRGDLQRATWMILAGAALAMLTMRAALGDAWREDLRSISHRAVSRRAFAAAMAVVSIGIAALAAYLILNGRNSVSLQGRGASYALIANEGRSAYLNLLAPVGLGGLFVMAARALERGSRLTFILAASSAVTIGALMALPGSRANLLYGVAPLLFMYVAYKRVPKGPWLVLVVMAVVVVLIYGTSLRNAGTRSMLVRDPWRTLLDTGPRPRNIERFFVIDVAHTEPLLGAMDAYPKTRPFLGGESVAIGFTGPVGWKFARLVGLHPDPPAGVTLTASAYRRDRSTIGSGLTATLPGELYANVGVPGVLLGFAAFGALAGWIRRRAVYSKASGTIALYAVGMTILFAIFADYTGQFIRGGGVLLGAGVALVAGGEKHLGLRRIAVIACAILAGAAIILTIRRFAGAPPAGLMTSTVPVYIALATVAMVVSRRTVLHATMAQGLARLATRRGPR
jgi:hypothetical protein